MKRPTVDSVDSFGRARGSAWGKSSAPDDVDDVRHNSIGQDPARCAECHSKNHPRDSICTRCGANLRPMAHNNSDEYRRLDDEGHYGRNRSFSNASSSYTEHHVRSGNDRYSERRKEDDEDGHYGPSSFRHEKEEDRRGYRDGRSSRKQHRNTSMGEPEPSRQCEWPPSFESGGAAYVFDARSAFFYEAASDFFYDPKTKLYFSNKKQMYFQHVPGNHPPYEQLLPDENQQTTTTPGLTASCAGEQPTEAVMSAADSINSFGVSNVPANKGEKKNKIMISIKKKPSSIVSDQRERSTQVKNNKTTNDLTSALKKSGDKSKAASSTLNEPLTLPQKVKKQHDADIAKWSRLGKEIRSEGDDASVKKKAATGDKTSSSNHDTRPPQTGKPLAKGEEVKKTASGQPICLLCKRKFANTDKLRQHEQISKLHKDNLAKKKKAVDEAKKAAMTTQSQTMPGAVEYRDRAKERRGMFESVVNVVAVPPMNAAVHLGPSLTRPRNVVETQVVRPDEHLGDSNIGNKMLQKLGWKTGQSLGRKQASATDQVGASDATLNLQQDWERIETMASSSTGANNAGRGTRGHHQAGIGGDASKHNYYGST